MKKQALFPSPKSPRLVRMHANDHMFQGGHFACSRCGHVAGWLVGMSISEVRRGVPCPKCNKEKS